MAATVYSPPQKSVLPTLNQKLRVVVAETCSWDILWGLTWCVILLHHKRLNRYTKSRSICVPLIKPYVQLDRYTKSSHFLTFITFFIIIPPHWVSYLHIIQNSLYLHAGCSVYLMLLQIKAVKLAVTHGGCRPQRAADAQPPASLLRFNACCWRSCLDTAQYPHREPLSGRHVTQLRQPH